MNDYILLEEHGPHGGPGDPANDSALPLRQNTEERLTRSESKTRPLRCVFRARPHPDPLFWIGDIYVVADVLSRPLYGRVDWSMPLAPKQRRSFILTEFVPRVA